MKRTPILTIWALSLIMVILLANPDNVWFWISFFIFSCSSIYIEKHSKRLEHEDEYKTSVCKSINYTVDI